MRAVLIIILSFILITACNPCKKICKCTNVIINDTLIDSIEVISIDIVIVYDENMSVLEAYFECDSAYQVVLKGLNTNEDRIKLLSATLKNNQFKVSLLKDSVVYLNKLMAKLKTTQIIIKEPVNQENENKILALTSKLTKWKTATYILSIIVLLIIIGIIIKIIK